jgi:hypothetical protein
MLDEGTVQQREGDPTVANKRRLRPRRILLVVPRHAAAPGLEAVVRALVDRGHRVDLAFAAAGAAKSAPDEGRRLAADVAGVRAAPVRDRRDDWTPLSLALRGPRRRARGAGWAARAIPTFWLIDHELTLRFPDVVIAAAAPPLPFEWLRSARRVGIRTALLAVDQDGVEAAEPALTPIDRAFVLDEAQRRTAIERHGLSPSDVTVVGAADHGAALADAVETLLEQPWPAPVPPRTAERAARPLLWLLSCSPLMPRVKGLRRSARAQRAAAALVRVARSLRRVRGRLRRRA